MSGKIVTEQNQYIIDIMQGGIPEKQGSWLLLILLSGVVPNLLCNLWFFELMFTGEVSLLSSNNFVKPQDECIKLGAHLEMSGLLHAYNS